MKPSQSTFETPLTSSYVNSDFIMGLVSWTKNAERHGS